MVNRTVKGPPAIIWKSPWSSTLGFHSGTMGLGIIGITNCIDYKLQLTSSDYAGYAAIIQIGNIDASGLDSGCVNALDGKNPHTDTTLFQP